MSQILITWREIRDGDFPNHCMNCGRHGATLVPRKLQTVHHRIVYRLRRWLTVELPFCELHERRPLVAWGRLDAAEFTDEGVWLKNVAPAFIDALWEHRDKADRTRKRGRHFIDEQKGRSARAERVELVDEEEGSNEDRPPPRRPQHGDRQYERPTPWVGLLLIVLAACFLLVLFCGLFAVNLVLPGVRNQGPGFGPQPGGAPFGPPGPIGPGRRFR
jgi:hypothetical protein